MEGKKGFAALTSEERRAIASKGGKSAHAQGRAHTFTSETAREAGRKGGATVAKDRRHMLAIARKGGNACARDREHMATIGRAGGAKAWEQRKGKAGA